MYKPVPLRNPVNGIGRRTSYSDAPLQVTPDAKNVFASDFSVNSGRDRISTRPGLSSAGVSVGTPYNWAEIAWTPSGNPPRRGACVTHSDGTRIIYVSGGSITDTEWITTNPGSDFSSSCSMNGDLFQASAASSSADVLFRALDSGTAGAGAALSTHSTVDGTPPQGCGIVLEHIDRLCLCGSVDSPRSFFMSASGLPANFDYADTNQGSAIAVAINFQQNITGARSHTRDCCFVGMVDSSAVIRGNPGQFSGGGSVEIISHEVGPVMNSAMCHDSKGNLWIFTRDGLYRMPPGCGDFLESVGREQLPGDLVAIDPGTSGTYVSLAYDHRWRCLHVFVDQSGSSNDQWWSYDLQQPGGGWWKHETSNSPLRLGVPLKSAATNTDSGLLIFNASGTSYQLASDSSETYDSSVLYGIDLAKPGLDGLIHALQGILAVNSDDVNWRLFTAASAEEAYALYLANTPTHTGAEPFVEGAGTWQHIRDKGAYTLLQLYTTASSDRWAVERIVTRIGERGLGRLHGV